MRWQVEKGVPFSGSRHSRLDGVRASTEPVFPGAADLPSSWWLSRILRGSGCEENPSAQEIEAGTTVHGPLHQLETRDLAFRLPVAPWRCERISDRCSVLLQPLSKSLERAHPARLRISEPATEIIKGVAPPSAATRAHEGCEPAGQISNPSSLWILLDPSYGRSRKGRQAFQRLDHQPGELLGSRQRRRLTHLQHVGFGTL